MKFSRLTDTAKVPHVLDNSILILIADSAKVVMLNGEEKTFEEYQALLDRNESNSIIKYVEYGTGISLDIPQNNVAIVSSLLSVTNRPMMLKNSMSILRTAFKSEIKLRFNVFNKNLKHFYSIGDPVGRVIVIPVLPIDILEEQ